MQHGMNREVGQGLREYAKLLNQLNMEHFGGPLEEIAIGFENAETDQECSRLAARGLTYFEGELGLLAQYRKKEDREYPEIVQIFYTLTRLNQELLKRHL